MKISFFISLLIGLMTFATPRLIFAASASVDLKLSPAGGFKGTTQDVKGAAKKQGAKVIAENIVVNLKALKTGMGLRDKHTQEHLETAKFPEAILVKAVGENGKGSGILKIRGVEKQISGSYKISGNQLMATFPIKLSDFNITNVKYMGVGVKDEAVVNVTVPVQ